MSGEYSSVGAGKDKIGKDKNDGLFDTSAERDMRVQLSYQRSRQSLARTKLATERTFSAWIRTGMAAQVAGLAVAKFIALGQFHWISKIIGGIFILISLSIYFIAFWSYRQTYRNLDEEVQSRIFQISSLSLLIIALVLSAVLSLVLLIL